MTRTLQLRSETLNELTTDELTAVNGGAFDKTIVNTLCGEVYTGIRCAISFTTCIATCKD